MMSPRSVIVNKEQPITALPGVGPARAALFAKLNVATIEDLLMLQPHRYLDFRRIAQPVELRPGDTAAVIGEVGAIGARRTRRQNVILCEALLKCAKGDMVLVWFLPARRNLKPPVQTGDKLLAAGVVSAGPRGLQIVRPYIEHDLEEATPRIIPVYPLTAGLQQNTVRRAVFAALPLLDNLEDPFPPSLLRQRGLIPLGQALCSLHAPSTPQSVEAARVRLAYDELFTVAVAMAWRRTGAGVRSVQACNSDTALINQWLESLPYAPTPGQLQAIADIRADMERSQPMQRLLHGDVGSGKTTVAMYAIVKALQNGLQAALLAPTRILAEQHYARWAELLKNAGVNTAVVIGGQQNNALRKRIATGEVNLVIGTHAILDLPYKHLGLVVVDEQHRFGVEQRAALAQRTGAHCLYLTATPIPRSLALTVWGDVDVTQITDKPTGRPPVDTRWILPEKRAEMYEFVRRIVATGQQVYIVYPRIEADEDAGLSDTLDEGATQFRSAEAAYRFLSKGPLSGLRLGLLHGGLATAKQDKVMAAFHQGELDVLVCTTVVEVGVDIANATVMIIEQADMFGLAQLHQLRGRVGRGNEKSYCLLVADPHTPEGLARIKALRSSDDGFHLAEEDLRLRGPGELLGLRQSGYGELQYARFPQDLAIVRAAREDAHSMLERDPGLMHKAHRALRVQVTKRFPSVSPVAG